MDEQGTTSRLSESSAVGNASETVQQSYENFDALMKHGFAALMPTIRASNTLPKGEQWALFCSSPLFKPTMDSLGKKALELMASILHHQGLYRDIRKRDLEEKYELIVEANDKILDRVDTHLAELSGIHRNPSQSVADIPVSPLSTASGSWNREVTKSAAWKEVKLAKTFQSPMVLRNARVTQRPQVKFLDKIDNSSTSFEPRITEKPNALKPLAILLETLPNEDECFSHPYEYELDRFQEKIDSLNLVPKQPQNPKPVETTPLLIITQEDQLLDMLEDLRTQTEIAVDLEHHSYRSFQGFTCLMQISTREKDYIIDTLELRHKLYVLNEVFTNPKIVKVFHGADSDIQWLQRDLSLYVVNMFDTYQAALLLSLPRLSLAFLLKSFCNIDANKHFQLYDWRTRPLAKEAIKYAREDTHYLLYIYDMLWNKLIEKSNSGTQLLQSVIYRSVDTCKKRYWKFIFKEDSYENMYHKSKKNFDNRQMYALKELYAWRDRIAREEDESSGYVLPNHMLLLIAEKLPKEMQGILACCNPIPPLVRQNLVLLHQVVLKAREQPLVARIATGLNSETRVRAPQPGVNLEGGLHCPHDLTHNVDYRDDLPTLLNNTLNDVSGSVDSSDNKPLLPIFGEPDEVEDCNVSNMNLPNQIHFMSPFERYKKMLSYIESEEKKSKEDKEEEIARKTQKLLDECMKERLLAASGNIPPDVLIKEENQENNRNPRKRDRSQDSSNCDGAEDNQWDFPVKAEENSEKVTHKSKIPKRNYLYEQFKAQVMNSEPQETINLRNETYSSVDECPPKKRKKMKNSNGKNVKEVMPMNVGAKKQDVIGQRPCDEKSQSKTDLSESFSQYDYSQVDYSQYQDTDLPQKQKRLQDKFKHKGKKNKQNRSFTFARQYGSGSSKKK